MHAAGMRLLRRRLRQSDAIKKLQSIKGDQLDAEYVKAQIAGHQRLLIIQEDYIAKGKDPKTLAVAKLTRGMIKEHLTLLGEFSKT